MQKMSPHITLLRPDGTPITNWHDWTPPKKAEHWKPERSALEFAKAWFRQSYASPPDRFMQLMRSSPRLAGLQVLRGIPELVTSLPERGEGRNHDLWLLGLTDREKVTICIEAKADEPFGNETVAEYRLSATERRKSGVSTRVPERISKLLSLVLRADTKWDNIRYQLLTALCGTAIQAHHDESTIAVFVVHEFHTSMTKPQNIMTNAKEFNRFVSVSTDSQETVQQGILYGPVVVGGIDILIGKVTE